MAEIYQLLNTGMHGGLYKRCRQWLMPGQAILIGRRLTLTVEVDRDEDAFIPRAVIQGPNVHFEAAMPPAHYLELSSWAGMMLLPRALELSESGRPSRVYLEFVALRDGVLFTSRHHEGAEPRNRK